MSCANCYCRLCRGNNSPTALVVTGQASPDMAPLLQALWSALCARMTADYQPRRPLTVDVVAAVGRGAISTVANLAGEAVRAGLLEQETRLDHTGRRRVYVRWTQPTTTQETTT